MGSDEAADRPQGRFFDLSGIDWDNDESIMRFADSVWKQMVEDQGTA